MPSLVGLRSPRTAVQCICHPGATRKGPCVYAGCARPAKCQLQGFARLNRSRSRTEAGAGGKDGVGNTSLPEAKPGRTLVLLCVSPPSYPTRHTQLSSPSLPLSSVSSPSSMISPASGGCSSESARFFLPIFSLESSISSGCSR